MKIMDGCKNNFSCLLYFNYMLLKVHVPYYNGNLLIVKFWKEQSDSKKEYNYLNIHTLYFIHIEHCKLVLLYFYDEIKKLFKLKILISVLRAYYTADRRWVPDRLPDLYWNNCYPNDAFLDRLFECQRLRSLRFALKQIYI